MIWQYASPIYCNIESCSFAGFIRFLSIWAARFWHTGKEEVVSMDGLRLGMDLTHLLDMA